jgi:hypothetical protein
MSFSNSLEQFLLLINKKKEKSAALIVMDALSHPSTYV